MDVDQLDEAVLGEAAAEEGLDLLADEGRQARAGLLDACHERRPVLLQHPVEGGPLGLPAGLAAVDPGAGARSEEGHGEAVSGDIDVDSELPVDGGEIDADSGDEAGPSGDADADAAEGATGDRTADCSCRAASSPEGSRANEAVLLILAPTLLLARPRSTAGRARRGAWKPRMSSGEDVFGPHMGPR